MRTLAANSNRNNETKLNEAQQTPDNKTLDLFCPQLRAQGIIYSQF